MEKNVNVLIEKMRQKTKEMKEVKEEMFKQEKDKGYLLNDGTYFTVKMISDLRMWNDFATEYGYNESGIKKLTKDLEELKIYKLKYGDII